MINLAAILGLAGTGVGAAVGGPLGASIGGSAGGMLGKSLDGAGEQDERQAFVRQSPPSDPQQLPTSAPQVRLERPNVQLAPQPTIFTGVSQAQPDLATINDRKRSELLRFLMENIKNG